MDTKDSINILEDLKKMFTAYPIRQALEYAIERMKFDSGMLSAEPEPPAVKNERNQIYAVTEGYYSDYHIISLTKSKEAAEEIAHFYDAKIEQYTDGEVIMNQSSWNFSFSFDGKHISTSRYIPTSFEFSNSNITPNVSVLRDIWTNEKVYKVFVSTDKGEDAALKIALDVLAEYRAEESGIC